MFCSYLRNIFCLQYLLEVLNSANLCIFQVAGVGEDWSSNPQALYITCMLLARRSKIVTCFNVSSCPESGLLNRVTVVPLR